MNELNRVEYHNGGVRGWDGANTNELFLSYVSCSETTALCPLNHGDNVTLTCTLTHPLLYHLDLQKLVSEEDNHSVLSEAHLEAQEEAAMQILCSNCNKLKHH